MPKRTSEKSSYSVDEMMDRLKEGEREKRRSEESELVTRPDGTQVVRVRRRRRRTQQPHKTRMVRNKRLGVIAVVALVLLLVGAGVTALILLARFNSKGYRDQLKEGILSSTGANAAINDLTVTPFGVRAKSVKFVWPTAGVAKSLNLSDVTADLRLTSFLSGEWTGTEALSRSGVLFLGPPDGTVPQIAPAGDVPFDYPSYRCSNTEIIFGKHLEEPAIQLIGTEMTVRPRDEGGVQLLVKGGRAQVGTWEELKVGRGLAELKDGRLELKSLRATPGLIQSGGEVTFSSVNPIRAREPGLLEMELTEFPIEALLDSSSGLGRMIKGAVSTRKPAPNEEDEPEISFDPRFLDSGHVTLDLRGDAVALEDFQFLTGLSDLLGSVIYVRPIGSFSGVLKQDRDGTRIQDLKFTASTDLKLEGNIGLSKDGQLAGTLRIGVPSNHVMMTTTQKDLGFDAFSLPKEGYCWLQFSLHGSCERPLDTFGSVLKDGPGQGGTSPGAGSDLESPLPGFELLPTNGLDRSIR